jgi:hypothetical protein
VAVEVEGDGAVEVGAVDVDSGVLQALEDVGLRQAEGISEADRDYGEPWVDRLQDFWRGGCGAAVMSYF